VSCGAEHGSSAICSVHDILPSADVLYFSMPSAVPLGEESSISSLRWVLHLPIVYRSILLDILSKFELKERLWSLPV
jgi:hypothetical protein